VVAALAPHLGGLAARDLVAELSRRARAEGRTLGSVLVGDARVRAQLDEESLGALLEAATDVGQATELVDRAMAGHAARAPSGAHRSAPISPSM
jgi:adenylosuccinate lyase